MTRRTKIVCTLGPASNSAEVIRALIEAGMDVARLNTSHGTLPEHAATIQRVRDVSRSMDRHIGTMMDLSGPKLRTSAATLPLPVLEGQVIRVAGSPGIESDLQVSFATLHTEIGPGERVLLDDGAVALRVVDEADGVLRCRALNGGVIGASKGVSFPDSELTLPAVTARDAEAIAAGVAAGVDFFALSFVQNADDIERARMISREAGADTPIIAKIERRMALRNLDEILEAADGVMVARGDLGVELPPEDVPLEQRRIIQAAARHLSPVITATQMLESMVHSPRPTRAESSDVANAAWDLSDALMLSAETAIGTYPVQAVQMMDRILRRAEETPAAFRDDQVAIDTHDDHSHVVALAVRQIVAADSKMKAIVCFTRTGRTARLVAKVHPATPIVAISPDQRTCRQLALARGVIPILAPRVDTSEELLAMTDRILVDRGILVAGDEVVVVASLPVRYSGETNFLKLHRVGESSGYYP